MQEKGEKWAANREIPRKKPKKSLFFEIFFGKRLPVQKKAVPLHRI